MTSRRPPSPRDGYWRRQRPRVPIPKRLKRRSKNRNPDLGSIIAWVFNWPRFAARHETRRVPAGESPRKRRRARRQKATEPGLRELQTRLALVGAILMAACLGLALNLYRLQVASHQNLQKLARQQQLVTVHPFIPRRSIIDRMGNAVALDEPVYELYAHPKLFNKSQEEIAEKLAPYLRRSPTQVLIALSQSESGIVLARDLAEEVVRAIRQERLDGLEFVRRHQRFYPYQDLMADVVGYVDGERQGQAGLEYLHQDLLARSDVALQLTLGAITPDPVAGEFLHLDDLSLQLTIDLRLQRAARAILKKKLAETGAKRGTVAVMDAKDGALLSLVCEPSYDPNRYYEFDVGLFKNWALTDLYEPGSTFKPIAVAIALEAGAIQPDSVFYDEGKIYREHWEIENFDYRYLGARGNVSVSEILKYSSNVGMVRILEQMKPSTLYNWLQRLGLGETTGIDLPFEMASWLRPGWEFTASPVHPATTSFGQGFALTPIQLLQLHGALANGGFLVNPHVVLGLFDSEGKLSSTPKQLKPERVFSAETSRVVVSMMENVVREGTGKNAKIPGYRIAGKTGTSQKVTSYSGGGYSQYAKITSFAAILPADSPRYVVLVVIDEPQSGSGGTVAAPVGKEMMQALISIEGIPPASDFEF